MALTKTPVSLNFGSGIDTKTDVNQVQIGKFTALQNSVFDTGGRLTKRNGFANITNLPNSAQTTLTTFSNNLIATGSNLYAFSQDTNQWLNRGKIQPIALNTLPLVRVSTAQTSPDLAVASSGLSCLVYVDNSVAYYQVSDSATGQQIVSRTTLPATATNPRVFVLGQYFIITFMATVSAASHLQYIAIPVSLPASPSTATDVSTSVAALTTGYDGVVSNNSLYLGWSGTGTTVKIAYLSSTLIVSATVSIASHTATLVSMAADTSGSNAVIYISYWDSSSTNGYIASFSPILVPILASTQFITTTVINELTSVATSGVVTVFYENANTYPSQMASGVSDFITTNTISATGTVGTSAVILRSVGLASKSFIATNSSIYMLVAFKSANQPTYFLIDSTGAVYMRLAYSNGGGYAATQVLPNVTLINGQYYVPYLANDFLATVNKTTNSALPANAIYTQTGVNLAKFMINTNGQYSSEIASALHLTGGQLWMYDGVRPVEHGFHVWPDNIGFTTASTGGSQTAQKYYYQFCYEWTDNQGNLHRSAPSIPFVVDYTSGTATNVTTLYVPTLRLTYKISPNPVRIVGYRWSVGQQVYYQFTSLTNPTLNNPAADFVTIIDSAADSSILGNTIIYTTGGVIEDIAAPASTVSALFNNRLFLVDAEDQNLLWYSKLVIEAVPIEMSDLLTLYVAPTTGAQGSTGPITALSAMDDKLIVFKRDAAYYLTGNGPDSTGANNDFTSPVYITSSVGCTNPNSIVIMQDGIMFQSDKGIWLLGRDMSTQYIGAPVEAYNSNTVLSAQAIPGTNQVRFVLNNGVTLMYDYYFKQWGTFSNISAISSTLYNNYQTYLNSTGKVFQESPGTYVDGSLPVLMSFTSAWIDIAGLQGYERFYFMYLLGTYLTPFKLSVQISYDYSKSASQSVTVSPDNYGPAWGGENLWGSGKAWGGPGNVFEARIFPQIQKCASFQISINELYDPSFGVAAGQGLTLSGMNLVVGTKRGYRTQKASRSFG